MLTINSDIVRIFAESADSYKDLYEAKVVLEDAESPLTTKLLEKLYTQVIEKSHIDFDSIPLSMGDIKAYTGYPSMVETLDTIIQMAEQEKQDEVKAYANNVKIALNNLQTAAPLYKQGFQKKNDLVITEYNLFVFCCVEATTSILSQYVEIVKGFKDDTHVIKFKNTKYKADKFYLEQISKFNKLFSSSDYTGHLRQSLSQDRSNFVGSTAVGVATVTLGVLFVVIPLLRLLVMQFYMMRTKIADALTLQAMFLEMNKACVEGNENFDPKKKATILKKQEKVKIVFERLAEKIRVDNVTSGKKREAAIKDENKKVSISKVRDSVDNAPLDFLL